MSAEIEIGFFSFTEITDPTEHRAYNEWHQLDHLPQQYEIPGIVFGQRWVSSPECKATRAFENERLRSVHYMTLYLMSEPVETTLEAFSALGASLHAAGRFHEHRKARLSGPFELVGTEASPRVLVSARVVPFRPNRGVYVVVEPRERLEGGDPDGTQRVARRAKRLLELHGVAGVWTFRTSDRFRHLRWHPGERSVTVCYLDEPPLEVSASLDEIVRARSDGAPAPELAGPFEAITPWRWAWWER